MSVITKRWIAAFLSMAVFSTLCWIAGYDFDSRGFSSFYVAASHIAIGILASHNPFIE